VTTRQLNPGEKITSRDFRMEEVDVTFAKDGVPKSSEVEGQLASRILSVNQPIFKSDYKKELAVTRGQLIRAISGNETFEVTSQAIAEEQGYVGDLIRIKNSESQKMLSGQIVEKGVVKVQ
jgi:flagella basal body P-ring formation protein FlgA